MIALDMALNYLYWSSSSRAFGNEEHHFIAITPLVQPGGVVTRVRVLSTFQMEQFDRLTLYKQMSAVK